MRERVKAEPHPAVIRLLVSGSLRADAEDNFENVTRANIAHAIALGRGKIISEADAGALLRLYREMLRQGPSCLELDPRLEDLHFNIEAYVIRQLGPDVGGRMHTGRSRNDLIATTTRMRAREAVQRLVERALELRGVLLDRAEAEVDTVMPGYTHMQPAQPITFGYYMAAVADALERDTIRLEAAYERTNRSALGAGALAGTGFPLDRDLLGGLLGFDGIVMNSLDAIASRDYVLEILAALAIMTSTVSRLAHDLYTWATDEFGLVEVADEVAIVSSIMPQKKNPVTLEHCKSKAAHLMGALVAALGASKSILFSHSRELSREGMYPLGDAVAQAAASVELMAVTLKGLSLRRDRMLARAQGNFSTVTELADALVRAEGLSFRVAHGIVTEVVVETLEAGKRADQIDAETVNRAAVRVLGHRLDSVDETLVRSALDPRENVLGRQTAGSPRPDDVHAMVGQARAALAAEIEWLAERRGRIATAYSAMEEAMDQFITQ